MENTDAKYIEKLRALPQRSEPSLQRRLADEEVHLKRQHRELRGLIQKKVFQLLWVQLFFLFALLLLQGFRFQGFQLNEWAFGILVNGALIQTFFIVRFIVAHLYPQSKETKK